MSLYKRLWIAIGLIMLLSFAGSFVLSNLSSRQYFEQQLELKNVDNATTLGLLLSTPQIDALSRQLLISAQFDTGHYQFIRLTAPDGSIIAEHTQPGPQQTHPTWLAQFFPINPATGSAKVSDGWQQIGTLTVASHTQVAYDALWNSSVQLLSYFMLVASVCGIIGSTLLRLITRPLDNLVTQAHAITERRFITSKEPDTQEFKDIVLAMNTLTRHVQRMVDDETMRLDSWRVKMQYDGLTSLMKRQPCLAQLHALLARNDASAAGTIMLIQVQQLAQLNQDQGRQQVDYLLKKLARTLSSESRQFDERLAGRLNGSDLLLVIPGYYQVEQLGNTIYQALLKTVSRQSFSETINLHCVASPCRAGDNPGKLLGSLNGCLKLQPSGTSSFTVQTASLHTPMQQQPWQRRLDDALSNRGIQLQYFPTVNHQGQLSHLDACARLKSDSGPSLSAAVFLTSLRQMGWCHRLDQVVVAEALHRLASSTRPLAISLSAAVLREPERAEQLLLQLNNAPESRHNLRLEFACNDAFLYLAQLRQLCIRLKQLGCKVGLKHLGQQLAPLGKLADSGLDYARIDGSFIRQLGEETEIKPFIQGICSTLHGLGMIVLAEQVTTENQWQQLLALGIDGGTGPLFNEARHTDSV